MRFSVVPAALSTRTTAVTARAPLRPVTNRRRLPSAARPDRRRRSRPRLPQRRTREDAAYGQSLAYLRVGLSNNAAVAATRAPQSRERAAELQISILADRALAAYGAKRYRETLIYLDQRAQIKRETVDLMVLRGYCYLNLKMYGDAERIFTAAAATGSKGANRGLADLRQATRPETSG